MDLISILVAILVLLFVADLLLAPFLGLLGIKFSVAKWCGKLIGAVPGRLVAGIREGFKKALGNGRGRNGGRGRRREANGEDDDGNDEAAE